MQRLVIATSNRGKLSEFRELLGPDRFEIVGLDVYPQIQLPEETGLTYADNALLKADAAASSPDLHGAWVLADDSGLEVDALDGRPGLYSARFATERLPGESQDAANRRELLTQLTASKRPSREWAARFVCWLALARPGQPTLLYAGYANGCVIPHPRGDNGFGYDPLLLLEDLGRTFAELSDVEKNARSHRGKAVRQLLASL